MIIIVGVVSLGTISSITAKGEDGPANGTTALASDSTTEVSYTPSANFYRKDSFSYILSDGNGGADAVTVAVAVVNNAPVATDDTVSVVEDATATDVDVTWNDTDEDDDTLSVSEVGQAANGVTAIAQDSTTKVSYTPDGDFHGEDSFSYTVSDDSGGTDTGTVTVTVSPVNDAPTFDAGDGPVSLTVDENTESGVDLGEAFVASDIDDAADELTYSLEGPDADSFELDASTGQLKTKAALDFETQSSYRVVVRVKDSGGGAGKEDALSDTITVDIAVTEANSAPLAVDDTLTAVEDALSTDLDVIWNDTDEDDDTLSVSEVGQAANGVTAIAQDSTTKVSYTPDGDFHGEDSFSYTVSDDSGGTDTGTVTVTVSSVNDAPTIDAGDGPVSLTVDENTESGVDLGEAFVASDIDDAADELTYSLEGPDADSFELDASTGQLKTKAALDFETQSSYRVVVRVTDSGGGAGKEEDALSDTITVEIAVTVAVAVVNNAPVATDDTVSVVEDATATDVDVTWNDTDADGDTLFVSAVSQPSKGTAAIAEGGTTQVTYTPNADTSGSDWFTYEVSDGNGGKDTGRVTVTVSSVNDAPTIDAGDGPVSLTVDENTESGVDLGEAFVASDIDDAADELTYSLEGPDADSFELDASTGQLKTKAALDFETQSSYRVVVRVTDSGGGAGKEEDALSDTITVEIAVTVAVAVVNNAPVATDDTVSVVEDATATDVDVTWNDTDADGDTLFVSAVSQPSKGTAAIAEGGTTQVTYTPNADTSGSDWFTYEVSDGNGGKDTGTVTVTVSSVNDAPTIDAGDGPVSLTVDENTESGVDLGEAFVASDIDDAADELTYSLEGPDADSFELDASTGQLKTKAALDFETQSSYRVVVRVTDSGGGAGKEEDALSDTITVEIAVTVAVAVVNNAPVATDDGIGVSAANAPSGLTATAGDSQVTLTWNNPNDNTITGYQVLQVAIDKLVVPSTVTGAIEAGDRFGDSVGIAGNTGGGWSALTRISGQPECLHY